jgi:heme exporter protein C
MNRFLLWIHSFGAPPTFYRMASRWLPWLWTATLITGVVGLWLAFTAPADYLQGESARIMYIHVPSAWMSMFIYAFMAVQGFCALVWRIKVCELLAMCAAPIGAGFTVVTLITGALWGRPTWGTYWVWDARLTSELVLLFLYLGVIALHNAIEDSRKASRAASLLAIIGLVNLPIIHYSVQWWNTLHQGNSINVFAAKSSIHPSMLWPLLCMAIATKLWFAASLLARSQVALLQLESGKAWASDILSARGEPSS